MEIDCHVGVLDGLDSGKSLFPKTVNNSSTITAVLTLYYVFLSLVYEICEVISGRRSV